MKLRSFLFIIVAALALSQIHCGPGVNPQESCGYVQNSESQRVSWKRQVPIKIYLDSRIPTEFHQAIQNAFATWAKGAGYTLFEVAGTIASANAAHDGKSVVMWSESWDPALANQQASTTIYWVGSRINEADMRLNAQNFFFSTNPNQNEVDIESLNLHELGHILGLNHNDATPSVMAKSLSSGSLRRNLMSADLSSVRCEY
jgi:predicted Zn-dependent protease